MNWDLPKQTFLVENGHVGDCWRCCIAAILQLPAAQVPHFLLDDSGNGGCSVDTKTQTWLNERGYVLLLSRAFGIPRMHGGNPLADYPRIVCGPSPRSKRMGAHHACVAIGQTIVYDPHPSGAGLTAITDEYMVVPVLPMGRSS